MEKKTGTELLRGARQAYSYLTNKFGSVFTALHRWQTFKKKMDGEAVEPFYQERSGTKQRKGTQRIYLSSDLERWFLSGFPSGKLP